MAVATKRADKVIGMHFHNPAPVMQLLEVVKTIMTGQETIEAVRKWAATIGKTMVVAPDVGGFIVTRLFTPFLLGAIRMLEAGIATRDEIDISMKLAVNHPMGPLEVIDFIGVVHGAFHSGKPLRGDERDQVRPACPPEKDGDGRLARAEGRQRVLRL